MANVLSGRVGLVTGVSRDGQVGQAVAQALAAEGALLGIAARTRETSKPGPRSCAGRGHAYSPSQRILRTRTKCARWWTA
jgi:NAD(P)-dependent dehydrogenase (short-subunit alcohol dehydrogenase family)